MKRYTKKISKLLVLFCVIGMAVQSMPSLAMWGPHRPQGHCGPHGPMPVWYNQPPRPRPHVGHHDDRASLFARVGILAVAAAGIFACWRFLGRPSVSYGGDTSVDLGVPGVSPIRVGFGATHDPSTLSAPGLRGYGYQQRNGYCARPRRAW